MWNSKPFVALFSLGLILLGFGLGQYLGTPSPAGPTNAPPEPFVPPPAPPVYEGPRPRAEFPAREPGAATAAASSDSTLAKVLREPDLYTRTSKLLALLPTLGPEAVPEVKDLLEDPAFDLGGVETDLLVRFWAEQLPQAATQWAYFDGGRPAYQPGAILTATEVWATRNPQSAEKFVRAAMISPKTGSPLGETGLVQGWFDSGEPGLEAYMQSLGMSFERQRALSAFARRAIQRNGPEPVARWAESISDDDPSFKLDAFRAIASELAILNPPDAVAWCEAHCGGVYGPNMRSLIAQRWAGHDGPAAMAWVAASPEGNERTWAVRAAFRGWLHRDPEGVTAWVKAKGMDGVEPYFNPALDLFAATIARAGDWVEGLAWAALIEDPAVRQGTQVTLVREWRNADQAAAEAWLEQSPLSEEARARVRAPLPEPIQGPKRKKAGADDSQDPAEQS